MVAGLVIIAMCAGAAAAAAAIVMSLPIWVAIIAYSLTGSLALVLLGVVAGGPAKDRPRETIGRALAMPPRH